MARSFDTLTSPRTVAAVGALMAAAGLVLLFMGRMPICRCGYVSLWHGAGQQRRNSQHLSDWYTFSHVIHGFGFYGAALAGRAAPALGTRLAAAPALAVLLEAGWEILENTDMVINRYREATIALDYYGDSVLNSLSDIGAMVAGLRAGVRACRSGRSSSPPGDGTGRRLPDSRQPHAEHPDAALPARGGQAVAGGLR